LTRRAATADKTELDSVPTDLVKLSVPTLEAFVKNTGGVCCTTAGVVGAGVAAPHPARRATEMTRGKNFKVRNGDSDLPELG